MALVLRPYQLACIYKLQNEIEKGKNRLFVSMPTGGGKMSTLASFFIQTLKQDEKVLFLHSRPALIDNTKSILSSSLLQEQYSVESIRSENHLTHIDRFNYIVVDLDDFRHQESHLVEKFFKGYLGIIIGITSVVTKTISSLITTYGELCYSLSLSEQMHSFLYSNTETVDILDEEETKMVKLQIPYGKLDSEISNSKIHELICSLVCERYIQKEKMINRQDLLLDLVALLTGFIPVIGSFIGVAFKHLYKALIKFISEKQLIKQDCKLCL
ncbi:DEAD/DEAH box helicase family protein [Paenibacillus cellulositrophicus]|uniref:DEAD/DEAH box helicase family protein n=1 Tax=Paenibacillus cellulositrophicus TaxID=562959 RepID=UPI00204179DF|nr:DEAD/DEAH box helicase family protein [Paenibacillus cellulositrophicus]MCM2996143.1 DEAD/DEAH box helicase family protein [Paenibacillus cellulositrophicus]